MIKRSIAVRNHFTRAIGSIVSIHIVSLFLLYFIFAQCILDMMLFGMKQMIWAFCLLYNCIAVNSLLYVCLYAMWCLCACVFFSVCLFIHSFVQFVYAPKVACLYIVRLFYSLHIAYWTFLTHLYESPFRRYR